ncbi:MAG: hypothetical protein ACRDSR_13695 [Pseudonocardiaceae bacterium]
MGTLSDPTPRPVGGAMPHLPTRTRDWLAEHPRARNVVHSVWDRLTELQRAGHDPGALDALRSVLSHHQPTPAGRCRTCPRVTGRRRPFPCIVWHQIRIQLLGLFAGGGQHRQAAGRGSSSRSGVRR